MTEPKDIPNEASKVEFKKFSKFNRGGVSGSSRRQVAQSSSSSDDECNGVIKRKADDRRKNTLFQATGGYAKRFKKAEGCSDSDSEGNEDNLASDVKVSYRASGMSERVGPRDLGATATLEIDTEHDRDETAVRKKAIEMNKLLKDKAGDKTYRGLNNYQQFYEKKDSILGNAGSGLNSKGPVRASGNIRATTRWDYEPCICKDYKETGYCGFGDSCKFLHDRSDYKMGWQIERQMEEGTYHPEDMSRYVIQSSGSESEEEDLPFRCFICRESFVDPIVTKCRHYFCEKCALNFFQKKSTRCFVCGEPTGGVFNPAKDIMKRIKRIQEKRAKKNDSDVDDEDQGEAITSYTAEFPGVSRADSNSDSDEDNN